MPTIDDTFFENLIGQEKVTELKQKYEQEIESLKTQNDQNVEKLTLKYEGEIKELKLKIFELTETVNEMKKIDDQKKDQMSLEKNGYIIECPFKNNELLGIFSYIEKNHICEVKISGGGKTSKPHPITNLIKYDDNHINDYYFNYFNIVTNESHNWIEFNFDHAKIKLNSYTIRTNNYSFHPKSWIICGSNDMKNWETIDNQENNSDLNGIYKQHRFQCKNESSYFQCIRYIQKDSWTPNRPFNIYLTCIELFGSILLESPPE